MKDAEFPGNTAKKLGQKFKIRSRIFRKTIPIQFVISQITSNYLVKNSLASNWYPFVQYPG